MSGAWRRLLEWLDQRIGFRENILPVLLPKVPPGAGWGYVFGSATLAAFLLQVVTGLPSQRSMFRQPGARTESPVHFPPGAARARRPRASLFRRVRHDPPCRGARHPRIHYRVVQVSARAQLDFGRVLLGLTLLMGFSGQVLRWDQDGVWSTVVAAEQAGRVPFFGHVLGRFILAGGRIGAATLSHIFAYHVFFVPAFISG